MVVLVGLAGCIGNGELETTEDERLGAQQTRDPRLDDDLFGWVVGPSFEGLSGVGLSVIGAPFNTTTNETGFYSFPKVPRGEELVVIAQTDGFVTQSKRVLLPVEGSMRVNFTLERQPVKQAWSEVLEFEGLIACQLVVEYEEGHRMAQQGSSQVQGSSGAGDKIVVDCGSLDPNNAVEWEFSVGPDLAGVVVEVDWEAQSPLAEHFQLTLEFPGHGGDNATLAQVVGSSVLKAQVNSHQAARYYQEGGFVRASVLVDPNVDDEETGTGLAFAYQQGFSVHATAFYVDPPPATYSVHG